MRHVWALQKRQLKCKAIRLLRLRPIIQCAPFSRAARTVLAGETHPRGLGRGGGGGGGLCSDASDLEAPHPPPPRSLCPGLMGSGHSLEKVRPCPFLGSPLSTWTFNLLSGVLFISILFFVFMYCGFFLPLCYLLTR